MVVPADDDVVMAEGAEDAPLPSKLKGKGKGKATTEEIEHEDGDLLPW